MKSPARLSKDAYATIRGLRYIRRFKATFISPAVREELLNRRLVEVDHPYLVITALGMAVPRTDPSA